MPDEADLAKQRRDAQRHPAVIPSTSPLGALWLMLALLLAGCGGGSSVAPTGLADRVAGARSSLEDNWEGGLIKPAFDFVGARCRIDGGFLLQFALHGIGASGFGYRMQGRGAPPDAWSGGFTEDLSTDSEIAFFFSESPEAACGF